MRHDWLMMAVLCLAATAAHAETIYKYRMPDGKILYTTETQARGTLLETMRDPPKPQPVDPARQNALREQSGQAKAANDRRLADLTAADAEVSAANRALQEAKARQTAGVEPAEGERIGTVRGGGRGRANEEYRERQRELQEAVDDAQRRLDEAYGKLNALK